MRNQLMLVALFLLFSVASSIAFADPPGMCSCCVPNSISDVGAFWYDHQDGDGVFLKCRLNYGTNANDSLALYVADNADGPARKVWTIKPLQSPPPESGTVVTLFHDAPLYSDCYHYWLDHGAGNFPSVRSGRALDIKPNEDNPICYSYGSPRLVFDPPDITQVADLAMNNGDELILSWSVSSDDAAVSSYNIYGAQVGDPNGFRWLGTVPHGVATFTHAPVAAGVSYAYKVSAAHGPYGVWNDFGGLETGVAIDELTSGLIAHSATWSGTMFVDGDVILLNGATLTIDAGTTVWVWPSDTGADLGPLHGLLEINVEGGDLVVQGTANNPVKFQAWNNGSPVTTDNDKWAGIWIGDENHEEYSSTATIDHAEIRNAKRGLQARGSVTLTNSTIENCKYIGVTIAGDNPNVDTVLVDIQNTTIRHVRSGGALGINALGSKAGVKLSNCVIDDCDIGIETYTNAQLYAYQTTVKNSGTQGVKVHDGAYAKLDHSTVESSSLAALKIHDGAYVDVLASTFKTSDHGIDIGAHGGDACGLILQYATITENEVGLQVTSGGEVTAASCTVTSNEYEGIYCFSGSEVSLTGSVLTGNESGIKIDASQPSLTGNTVKENAIGVYCETSALPILRKNKIWTNEIGLYLLDEASANIKACTSCPSGCADANSFKENSPYTICNDTSVNLDAKCTYWGGSVPAQGTIYGPVSFIPYLTSNPLPVAPMQEVPLPKEYSLAPNYPNPFNPITTIAFDVPAPGGLVRIRVFNVSGQLVKNLVGAIQAPGHYEMTWDGRGQRGAEVAAGVYFLDMVAPNYHKTRKLVLIK